MQPRAATRSLTLTKGYIAIIDEDDFERLNQWSWHAFDNGKKIYGARGFKRRREGICRTIYLHRFILNAPDGTMVDHINGDTLDCRKANLRLATASQNQANSRRAGRSGFKGVRSAGRKSWQVIITVNGLAICRGRFKSPDEAARAYDQLAIEHFGEFACLNFPTDKKKLEAAFQEYAEWRAGQEYDLTNAKQEAA